MIRQKAKSVLFVTTTLGTGGAEQMLLKILQRLDRDQFDPVVVSLLDEGTVGKKIKALGIPVICLRMDRLVHILAAPFVLGRLIQQHRFDLIQGWMYHGNLLAWLGRFLANSHAPLSFGVRQSFYGLSRERFNTRWVIRANAWLSERVQGCVFNSFFSLETHRNFGFGGSGMRVIPNGFDVETFAPCPEKGVAVRSALQIADELVVGMVARFHPVKGHHDFLRAAKVVHQHRPDVKFLLAGTGVTEKSPQLMAWIDELGIAKAVLLLGERSDISDLNNVFDIACLASKAEAFPNAIGESMACGVPCVVTDVGDCADIVGPTGRVVRAGEPELLAMAMLELLEMAPEDRQSLGRAARRRIMERFDMDRVAQHYGECFHTLVSKAKTS
ncbi:glycosyltransferase [Castellaniella ginsengisoli]|uniref:Glycosyltransferase n=1 Tax=Castellaniella ginsengisoli TaxID=546114 RepID=A0AB39F0Z3_9BURK